MIAKQLITRDVFPVQSTDTGAFALSMMEAAHLSNLPVVDGEAFVGIVTDQEIYGLAEPDLEIGNYPNLQKNVSVNGEHHVYEALKMFSLFNLTLLPVVDDQNRYLGGITLPKIVSSLAGVMGIHDPGGIIVLQISDKDYSLAEIVQVVESNDAKILSCFVSSEPGSSILEVTIKVNRMEIGPLLQAFFRLNYLVTYSWSNENSYNEGLQDRFDALMNYLNI